MRTLVKLHTLSDNVTKNILPAVTDSNNSEDNEVLTSLLPNVIRIELSHIKEYIPVWYNESETNVYYGGNQSWFFDADIDKSDFEKSVMKEGCCGLIAAIDLIMYITLYNDRVKKSDKFSLKKDTRLKISYISYEDYKKFFIERFDELSPIVIMKKTFGYPPKRICKNLRKYFNENNINVKVSPKHIFKLKKEEYKDKIICQLQNDIPVMIMKGNKKIKMQKINTDTNEVLLNKEESVIEENFDFHWVNIVGIIMDNIKNTTKLEVSSWGEKYLIDFDDYYENCGLLDFVVWVKYI